ncbi:MAG: YlxR family protein [Bacilli bacterium]|nr:YlxR family protein [Bacilli bacterium]
MKKIPMRTCVVTREKLPKNELIRIVKTNDGIIIDESGKVNGHGCYLKKDENVIRMAQSKKILNRILEAEVPDCLFEDLLSILK